MIKSENSNVVVRGKGIELLHDMGKIATVLVKCFIKDGMTQKEVENLVRAACESGIQAAFIKDESDIDALTKEILKKIARGMY